MRVSKSSLHDSTHCASCSGLITLCFVVKSNQTSLYDTILNPIHTWKFIIRVFEICSTFSLFHLNISLSVRPLGDLLLHLFSSSALPVAGTHRKTQMPPGVSLSSLCPSSCILSLCSLQRGACVLYVDLAHSMLLWKLVVGMQSNANPMLLCTVLSLCLPDVCRLSVTCWFVHCKGFSIYRSFFSLCVLPSSSFIPITVLITQQTQVKGKNN